MALVRKYILDPEDWGNVVKKAKKAEKKKAFPTPTLGFDKIETRWSADKYHVVIGMRSELDKAETGFVQHTDNKTFVDRVFRVPWDN